MATIVDRIEVAKDWLEEQNLLLGFLKEGLARSLKVLARVKVPADFKDWVYIEAYANGREHGFAICGFNRKLVFSESRNSDSMVLYIGKVTDFSMAGNVPSEKTYGEKLFFGPENDDAELVEFIEQDLKKQLKNLVQVQQEHAAKEAKSPTKKLTFEEEFLQKRT